MKKPPAALRDNEARSVIPALIGSPEIVKPVPKARGTDKPEHAAKRVDDDVVQGAS